MILKIQNVSCKPVSWETDGNATLRFQVEHLLVQKKGGVIAALQERSSKITFDGNVRLESEGVITRAAIDERIEAIACEAVKHKV